MLQLHNLPERRSPKALKPGSVDLPGRFCRQTPFPHVLDKQHPRQDGNVSRVGRYFVSGVAVAVLWRTHRTQHIAVILVVTHGSRRMSQQGERQRGGA